VVIIESKVEYRLCDAAVLVFDMRKKWLNRSCVFYAMDQFICAVIFKNSDILNVIFMELYWTDMRQVKFVGLLLALTITT
jgi:hypothetical protein